MAQRPPRMPRRPATAHPQHSGAAGSGAGIDDKVVRLPTGKDSRSSAELPTDAMNVIPVTGPDSGATRPVPARAGAPKPGPGRIRKPGRKPEQPAARGARFEKAKQKQSQRRRVDRVKFSAAVRRKHGEPMPPHVAEPAPRRSVEPETKPVAAHRFSGRMAALLVVLAFFAVMLVPTVNHYRSQMHEINELRSSIAQLEAEQGRLQEEIARWDDPLYIKQQARDRINLVMPGERVYMVVGQQPSEDDATPQNASTYEVRQKLPWVDALLDSMHRAGTD